MSVLSPKGLWQVTAETVRHVTKHRELTWAMAKRDFADRNVGRIFGAFWSIGHSLALMGIFVFIFSYVFGLRVGGTLDLILDFSIYLLSGLLP